MNETFFEKLNRTIVFTDLLIIGFIFVWFISIFFHIIGMIPADLSNIIWTVHTLFGAFALFWFTSFRARWVYTPEELRDVVNFNTGRVGARWTKPSGLWWTGD